MAGSNVKVSLSALSELKSKLSQLSGSLHEIARLMNQDLSKVGNEWRDGKYEEYKESYSKEVKNCEEIGNAYEAWCKEAIDPLMERTEDAATSQVTPGGGSSVKGGSAAAGAGAAGAAAASAKSSKAAEFNTGTGTSGRKVVPRSKSNAKLDNKKPSHGSDAAQQISNAMPEPKEPSHGSDAAQQISDAANVLCANPNIKKATLSSKKSYEGDHYDLEGKVKGEVNWGIGKVKAEGGGHYDSGKQFGEVNIGDVVIDCNNGNTESN